MALSSSSSWFQSWSPPSHTFPENFFRTEQHVNHLGQDQRFFNWNDDSHRFTHHRAFRPPESSPNMANFIPYLLSLGLVSGQSGETLETPEPISENTGPFKTIYAWKQVDFAYPSESAKREAISNGKFIAENNLPLGVEIYKDRIFVSLPQWKQGVPASLGYLPRKPREASPKIIPYPNWEFHNLGCNGLTSVYRMQADECGRLWAMDSGQAEVTIQARQICPPQLFIFDLKTDKLILRYPLPKEFVKQDSLYSNIRVDVRNNRCDDAHAYMTDVWRFGLVVFSLKNMRSWRVTDHLFYPEPLAAAYKLNNLEFEWTDGIFGMALSPIVKTTNDRVMYFHPMSSFREFYVKTSVIRNETGWSNVKDAFKLLGQSRGKNGHTSASAMDDNGILFFNQVTRNSVGCWDSRKPYRRENLGVIGYSNETLVFPNDLKINMEGRPSVWVLSNRLPIYLYSQLDPKDVNFRILAADINEAIKDTICDPEVPFQGSGGFDYEEDDCY